MTIKTMKRQHNKIKARIKHGHTKAGDIDKLRKLKVELGYET